MFAQQRCVCCPTLPTLGLDGQLTQGLCVSQCVSGAALVSVINTYFPLPEREATGLPFADEGAPCRGGKCSQERHLRLLVRPSGSAGRGSSRNWDLLVGQRRLATSQ